MQDALIRPPNQLFKSSKIQNKAVSFLGVAWLSIGLTVVGSSAILLVLFVADTRLNISVANLTRDVTATSNLPPYVGFFSQIGLFCWFCAATLCLFCSIKRSAIACPSKIENFLKVSAILLFFVGMDDAFLFHEHWLPALGIPEKTVTAIYGFGTAIYLLCFSKTILRTKYFFLAWATLFFCLSVWADESGLELISIEDGAKFVGIVSLLIYFFGVANDEITHQIRDNQTAISK